MIDAKLIEDKGILKVIPETSLEKADFERLELMIDAWRENHGPLHGIMIHTERFPGWDSLSAMLKHFRFVREHHNEVRRVALVTDSSIGNLAPEVAGPFLDAEVKTFPFEDNERALNWLASDIPKVE